MPLFFFCLVVVMVFVVLLLPIYQRDKREALHRYQAISKVIQTPYGPLEYATTGNGYPVVVLHGMGGGYEQGLLMNNFLDPSKYQIIAVSRSGYRRTPLATGPSFEEQADAVERVLDVLKISSAAIIGISGGGPASLQFALHHPDRCLALVLLSAHGPATLRFMPPRILLSLAEGMVSADFLLWLALKLPAEVIPCLEGCRWQRIHGPESRNLARDFLDGFFPATDWKNGLFNDVEQLFALEGKPDWPLEQITTPTLVLHGERDHVVRFASAQSHAERIPDATLIAFEDGTHMSFVTHLVETRQALGEFLQ